jgi:cytochrome b
MVPILAVSTFTWIVLAFIWIMLAFWPARVAGRKGHSFVGYFILSLFVFPLALILAYAVGDRRRSAV